MLGNPELPPLPAPVTDKNNVTVTAATPTPVFNKVTGTTFSPVPKTRISTTEAAWKNLKTSSLSPRDNFSLIVDLDLDPEEVFSDGSLNLTWEGSEEQFPSAICIDLFTAELTTFSLLSMLILATSTNLVLTVWESSKAQQEGRTPERKFCGHSEDQ